MQPLATANIESSCNLSEACNRFLDDLGQWIDQCLDRYGNAPPTDVHDQMTYTTCWPVYMRARQHPVALQFMANQRDTIAQYMQQSEQWHHGYWRMQEAHHGVEHFELFLTALWHIEPAAPNTVNQYLDATEHIGNWSADVPDWYDWSTRLFRSMWFGTDGVKTEPGMDLNVPDHLRCVSLCLNSYKMSGDKRYLQWAGDYAGHWAQVINETHELPGGLTVDGPIFELDSSETNAYHAFAGMAKTESAIDRAENFLASNVIQTFLNLWQITRQEQFMQAAQRILDVLIDEIHDPDAGCLAAALADYRQLTGDPRYDRPITQAIDAMPKEPVERLSLTLPQRKTRPSGVGKRTDTPQWHENDQPRRINPILLAVEAERTHDTALGIQALDLARTYFNLARQVFPDGRDHGCSARSVSAIARGHGRENQAGMVTAVLDPLLSWAMGAG